MTLELMHLRIPAFLGCLRNLLAGQRQAIAIEYTARLFVYFGSDYSIVKSYVCNVHRIPAQFLQEFSTCIFCPCLRHSV